MKTFTLNPDLNEACEILHDALAEGTDSIAFDQLTTQQLLLIQTHINKLLIERFGALNKGIVALVKLETHCYNNSAQ